MSQLVRTMIDGRPATVAYLTEMGGSFTTPENAGVVMVNYDDGSHAIFVKEREPGTISLHDRSDDNSNAQPTVERAATREQMRIVWVEANEISPGRGHGIDFSTGPSEDSAELVAVLRGFEWLHGDPAVVEVRIRSASTTDSAQPGATRASIERYIRRGKAVQGLIAPELYAHING